MLFADNHRVYPWLIIALCTLPMLLACSAFATREGTVMQIISIEEKHIGRWPQGPAAAQRAPLANEYPDKWQSYLFNFLGQQLAQNISTALNQYGQAQVDITFDNDFGLRGRLDWLAPVYEKEERLFFTQIGMGNEKNSTVINLGLGQRHFHNRWMLGYHAFMDADLKHRYWRTGLGGEAGHDYLKIGTNFYFPLSGWRFVPEYFSDARPARGYEVRATAYLPFYPKVGAHLKYERYFGTQVGWFSENKLSNNPAAWTFGVRYTPVPLLTLAFDRRMGAGAFNETRAFLRFNIDLHRPLNRQFVADAVKPVPLADSQRYSIVERTNAIYLEYKPDVLHAVLPATLVGDSHMNVNFSLQVKAKNPLASIKWVGSAAMACGSASCVSGANGQYMLALPAYSVSGGNQYTLQAQVIDRQGNSTLSNPMMVTVSPELVVAPVIPPMALQSMGDQTVTVAVNATPFSPIAVSGGTAPYIFSMGTPLPLGLTLDPSTGVISGLPSVATPLASYQVVVTDAAGASVSASFNLRVSPPPLIARSLQRTTTEIVGLSGQMFWPVRGTGGTPPYTLTISPSLPAGLSKDADGRITGIPTVATPRTVYTVTVVDSAGAIATQTFNLTILP